MAGRRTTLVALHAVQVADTPTTLVPWVQLGGTVQGASYEAARFDFFNDSADTVTIDVETSADGVTPDSFLHWQFPLAPGEHRSFPVPNEQLPKLVGLYWFASGQKASAGLASVRVGLDGYQGGR